MAKTSAMGQDLLPLPSGGGSGRPIDETFKTDLGTGTGSFEVPLKLPRGVNNFTPNLSLKYSTGRGNSPFGMGWSVDIPGVFRSADRQLPSYVNEDDIFLFEGRELVHSIDDLYRPLTETEFSRIKKLDHSWEVRTKSGVTMQFGTTADSLCSAQVDGVEQEWAWLLASMTDMNGNSINYEYEQDGNSFYLKSISYAIYRIEFTYEERPDVYSNFRMGFEQKTVRRCVSIQLVLLQPAVEQVKRYIISYEQASYSQLSLMKAITLHALYTDVNGPAEMVLPPISFSYSQADSSKKKLQLFEAGGSSAPPSLLSRDISLLDYEGTGLPGIIEIASGTARFWPNKGGMRWGQPTTLRDIPVHADLGDDQLLFADMEGNGTADLLQAGRQASGYYPNTPGGSFGRKIDYRQSPNVPLGSLQTRMIDLDGDSKVDMMYSDGRSVYYYYNRGKEGWDERPELFAKKIAGKNFPEVDLGDPHIHLGDIVGDGRTHIVQVHSGRVLFWPNLGNGKWGEARRMQNAPVLPRNYSPQRLFLADIDGSGAHDIIYVDYDKVYCWINQSGRSFSDPVIIHGTPPVANAAIVIADMKGTATNGILWSYEDGLRNKTSYRFLEPFGGIKPYLLTAIINTSEVKTTIGYGSSSEFQKDKTDARLTGSYFLPFIIPVVKSMEVTDPSTGVTSKSSFRYFCGHFDGESRQFLGFAKAERVDEGDAAIPANRTVSYYHNRDPRLKGLPYLTEIFGEDGSAVAGRPYKSEETEFVPKMLAVAANGKQVNFIEKRSVSNKTWERTGEFSELKKTFEYDDYGNTVKETKETRWKTDKGNIDSRTLVTDCTYCKNDAEWLQSFKKSEILKDPVNNKILQATYWYYDGPDFEGLPAGQVTKGNLYREKQLAMTVDLYEEIFGPVPADLSSLGYIRENSPELGDCLFVNRIRQKTDASGNPSVRKNPFDLTTIMAFDAHHIYPAQVSFSNGLAIMAEYEYRYGSMIKMTDQNEVQTRMKYDPAGQLTAVYRHDDPEDSPYISYAYNLQNIPRSQTTYTRAENTAVPDMRIEYFDGLGQKLQVRSDAEGNRFAVTGKKEFNAKGLMMRECETYFSNAAAFSTADQTHAGIFTEYHYDALGRSISRSDFNGNVYKTVFGLCSRMFYDPSDLDATPGNDNHDTPKTEWTDAEENLVCITETKKNSIYTTRYEYDACGKRTKVLINNSVFVENTYDCTGHRIRSAYRDSGVYSFLHDALGNLVERKDGKNDIIQNKYDVGGRLKEVRFGGNLVETYVYDTGDPGELNTKGKLVKVSGPFGEMKLSYSKCGCVKSKKRTFPGLAAPLTTLYEQDNLRRFKKITYPDAFELNISYNRGGLIDSIPGFIDKIDYGPTGKRTRISFANGVVTEYSYEDASFFLKSIKTLAPDGATSYQDMHYDYTSTGLISSITDAANAAGHVGKTTNFRYDELDQLTTSARVFANGNLIHDYEYDESGNLRRMPEEFGADHLVHGDADHPFRITQVENHPGVAFQYDGAGNITDMPGCHFEYDARNQLTKVEHENGTVIEYFYDHLGSRVMTKTTVNGNTETLYNFDDIYTIKGNEKSRFVFDENSQVAMMRPDGSGLIFLKDHLGSHTVETDLQTGALLNEQDYYAFGKMAAAELSSVYNFSGKKFDAVPALVFFGGRYYVPAIGRFLTPDPYFLEQQPDKFFKSPRSLQLYCYVLNNPVNIIDPFGLWFGIDDLIAAAVGFVAGMIGYVINVAVSGGSFSLSEMLYSGLVGAVSLWFGYNTFGLGFAIFSGIAMLAGPAICGGLDKASMGDSFGERFLGFLSFAIKFARSPITSTVGLIIGGFGTGFGAWNDVEWFKGGVIAFEYDKSASGFSAVTLGATVNIWQGNTSSPSFQHELYHSRQYTILGDWFIPGWVVGGLYGMISGAIGGSSSWGSCFYSANPNKGYGNPLEAGAHSVSRGGGCA